MSINGLKAFGKLFIGFGIFVLILLILYILLIKRKEIKNKKEKKSKEKLQINVKPPEYVDGGTSIYEAVKIYPFLLRFFIKSGLKAINNPIALNVFGKRTSISDAAKKIGKKPKAYLDEINNYIYIHLSKMKPKEHINKKH